MAISGDGTRLLSAELKGKIFVWTLPARGPARVTAARQAVPRCLTTLQLETAGLDPVPPRWCITGPEHVAEADPSKWNGKWPYRTQDWRNWLAARDRRETPPWPNIQEYGPEFQKDAAGPAPASADSTLLNITGDAPVLNSISKDDFATSTPPQR